MLAPVGRPRLVVEAEDAAEERVPPTPIGRRTSRSAATDVIVDRAVGDRLKRTRLLSALPYLVLTTLSEIWSFGLPGATKELLRWSPRFYLQPS